MNQIIEEDPEIDRCDEEEFNDRDIHSPPQQQQQQRAFPPNVKLPQPQNTRPLTHAPVALPSQAHPFPDPQQLLQ